MVISTSRCRRCALSRIPLGFSLKAVGMSSLLSKLGLSKQNVWRPSAG